LKALKKQIRTLLEIGGVYLAVSIALDFFLKGYPVLTWSALAIAFLIFAVMMIGVVLELGAGASLRRVPHIAAHEDELMRLERLSEKAIDDGNLDAGLLLSNRLRSVVFAAAAHRFDTSEVLLRDMAEREPNLLRDQIGDSELAGALASNKSLVNRGTLRNLEYYLAKTEEWSN